MTAPRIHLPGQKTPARPWVPAFLTLWLGALWILGSLSMPMERVGYVAYRRTWIWYTEWHLRHDRRIVTPQFLVLYPTGHQTSAREILHLAENSYPGETASLGVDPKSHIVIALYPSQSALNRAVGISSPQNNNIGFYWHGVIDVLGPHGLHKALGVPDASYAVDGPMAHELGHALLNLAADGNYPAWFNEGIAQWEDYRQTGYQWLTSHNYLRHDALYPYSALSSHFYALPHQSLAYREGLVLIKYLVQIRGSQNLRMLIKTLKKGTPFALAVKKTYGVPIQSLFIHWQQSLGRSV